MIVYGQEGVGKSTFAAGAPKPIFLPTEDGLGQLDVDSFPVAKSYDEFVDYLGFVATGEHEYQTLVVDSLDWLEKLKWAKVTAAKGVKNIEDIGFAKGYSMAMDYWDEVLSGLEHCHTQRGMIIVLVAHAKVDRFNDPESQGYDRYTLSLHKSANDRVREWADAVLFACRKTRVETHELGFKKTKVVGKAIGGGGGDRVLRCEGSPACVAKNRYGISGDIPLSWSAFEQAISQSSTI